MIRRGSYNLSEMQKGKKQHMKTMVQDRQKGVTLIELLIVVVIIAALAAIAIPRIGKSAENAKAKACHQNIDIINTAIEHFRADKNRYPVDLLAVTRNRDYFPDGEPLCPVTDNRYPRFLLNKRVDARFHRH